MQFILIQNEHRTQTPWQKTSKSKYNKLVIIAKFATWSFSEKVKLHFISASQEGQTEVIASQMYSKSVNERKKSLELRMRPKRNDPSLLVYVKYPAELMVKRSKEHKCTFEKAF